MPQPCTICIHQSRTAIEHAMVADQPNRAIGRQWLVSKDAVARHKADHLPETLTRAQDAEQVAQADDLLAQVQALHERTLTILKKAEDTDRLGLALGAIREARGNLELLGRLEGKLREQQVVNILVMPQWLVLRTAIIHALAPYPDARAAVAAALTQAEQ